MFLRNKNRSAKLSLLSFLKGHYTRGKAKTKDPSCCREEQSEEGLSATEDADDLSISSFHSVTSLVTRTKSTRNFCSGGIQEKITMDDRIGSINDSNWIKRIGAWMWLLCFGWRDFHIAVDAVEGSYLTFGLPSFEEFVFHVQNGLHRSLTQAEREKLQDRYNILAQQTDTEVAAHDTGGVQEESKEDIQANVQDGDSRSFERGSFAADDNEASSGLKTTGLEDGGDDESPKNSYGGQEEEENGKASDTPTSEVVVEVAAERASEVESTSSSGNQRPSPTPSLESMPSLGDHTSLPSASESSATPDSDSFPPVRFE